MVAGFMVAVMSKEALHWIFQSLYFVKVKNFSHRCVRSGTRDLTSIPRMNPGKRQSVAFPPSRFAGMGFLFCYQSHFLLVCFVERSGDLGRWQR